MSPRRFAKRREALWFVVLTVLLIILLTERDARKDLLPPLPRLALVIDDFGYADESSIAGFFALDIPFSAAILPYQPFSRRSAEAAHRTAREVILHLPMEGRGGYDPGPAALKTDLDEAELRSRTRRALDDLPFVTGASNHMGSVLTQDTMKVRWILEEIRARSLFFVDSRTTANTAAETLAHRMGIRSVSRNVFLDDSKQFEAIEQEWTRAIRLAERRGSVLVIGHVYPETLRALEVLIPRDRGRVRFVLASALAR